MRRPGAQRNGTTDSVPELARVGSPESAKSPMTPTFTDDHRAFVTPVATEPLKKEESDLKSKDLPFLKHDPYAPDDDVIPFDKHKPIVPSRSGSIRSFVSSTSSIQSLKRGFGSIKRKLSRRRPRKGQAASHPEIQYYADDGITPINRSSTATQGIGTFSGPKRVDTYQMAAVAF